MRTYSVHGLPMLLLLAASAIVLSGCAGSDEKGPGAPDKPASTSPASGANEQASAAGCPDGFVESLPSSYKSMTGFDVKVTEATPKELPVLTNEPALAGSCVYSVVMNDVTQYFAIGSFDPEAVGAALISDGFTPNKDVEGQYMKAPDLFTVVSRVSAMTAGGIPGDFPAYFGADDVIVAFA